MTKITDLAISVIREIENKEKSYHEKNRQLKQVQGDFYTHVQICDDGVEVYYIKDTHYT